MYYVKIDSVRMISKDDVHTVSYRRLLEHAVDCVNSRLKTGALRDVISSTRAEYVSLCREQVTPLLFSFTGINYSDIKICLQVYKTSNTNNANTAEEDFSVDEPHTDAGLVHRFGTYVEIHLVEPSEGVTNDKK